MGLQHEKDRNTKKYCKGKNGIFESFRDYTRTCISAYPVQNMVLSEFIRQMHY